MDTLKQRIMSSRWVVARILFCCVALYSGFVEGDAKRSTDPYEDIDTVITASAAMLVLFPLGLVGAAAALAASPRYGNVRWEKPDWKHRPFLRKGPFHFLHLGASTSIATGIGASTAYLAERSDDLVLSIMPIVMGGAVLFGINITQSIFANRYATVADDVPEVQLPLRNELMIAGAWMGVFLLVAGLLSALAYLTYLSLPVVPDVSPSP